jgi:predicted nucleotidyltransferase
MPYSSILDQRKSEIAAICRRHRVAELAVFGSAARGEFRSDSDIDFLVEFVPGTPIGLLELGRLQTELEAARAICGFRNFIAHEYSSLDSDIIWETVTTDVPSLEMQIAEILSKAFP